MPATCVAWGTACVAAGAARAGAACEGAGRRRPAGWAGGAGAGDSDGLEKQKPKAGGSQVGVWVFGANEGLKGKCFAFFVLLDSCSTQGRTWRVAWNALI